MITVQVDGSPLPADLVSMKTMGDLVEFVKASIDPDTMITNMTFSGTPLSENDWNMPLSYHRGRTLEVSTGSRQAYLTDRLETAISIIDQIQTSFAQIADTYRNGDWPEGNKQMSSILRDLNAFVGWYVSILEMDPVGLQGPLEDFDFQVRELKDVCEELFQQQLYNSWWAVAETITNKLQPVLQSIGEICLATKIPE